METSYKKYLVDECGNQKVYKNKLERQGMDRRLSDVERQKQLRKAQEFELSRCIELGELFGVR